MVLGCNPKWTDWLDRDTPEGDGDDESLALHLNENPLKICKTPIAIEARLSDGRYKHSCKVINKVSEVYQLI